MFRSSLIVSSLSAALWTPTAFAQLVDENVLVKIPKGFVSGYDKRNAEASIVEYVRQGETVDNWSEMVTSRIYFRSHRVPEEAADAMRQGAAKVCDGNVSTPTIKGSVNGYPFATWVDQCPLNVRVNKPEWTVFKVIGGQDAMYMVMRSFRFEPSREQLKQAIEDVRDTVVCDTRGAEHPCPPGTH